jgi:uncharacterized membrane protein YkvA (DUF1232 family)
MTYAHLFRLLKEAGMSPEQLGERLGIAGITIRRWMDVPKGDALPILYEKALTTLVMELIVEGRLSSDSNSAKLFLKKGADTVHLAAIKSLGFSDDFFKKEETCSEDVVEAMAHLGADKKKQALVEKSKDKIESHWKLGKEWKSRLQTLWNAITSKNLSTFEKFAAYGALFYLISPFDLIPDHIPIFGLMDDYVILGLAVSFYLKRFPALGRREEE